MKAAKPKKTDLFALLVQAAGLPAPEPEFRFAPPRRWRFDWAFPEHKIALEQEGGIWTGGRHTTGQGFLNDIEKYNECALRGWLLIRATPAMFRNGVVLALLKRAFETRKEST